MLRAALAVTVGALWLPAGVANATPNGPPPPPPPCSFTLSAPQPDGAGVTAAVQSTGCAPLGVPYLSVACLQPSDAAMSCSQARGGDPARISLPYRPGVTYTATGRGCARWVGLDPHPDCRLLGPNSATPQG
jgi:hypothetical protein